MHIVGICGGSCSGKTSFARKIQETLGSDLVTILYQDNYYLDQSSRFDSEGGAVNFDHPEAIDFSMIETNLNTLKSNESVDVPVYDFKTHARKDRTVEFFPRRLVLLDGTLILSRGELIELMSLTFFIQCPRDLRLERRLKRDIEERGRTPEGVKLQFDRHVEPMHQRYVEPSSANAGNVLTQDQYFNEAESIIEELFRPLL